MSDAVNSPNSGVGNGIEFRRGHLYLHLSRRAQLMRLVVYDESQDTLIFKLVELEWSKVERLPIEMPLEKARTLRSKGKLQEHVECITPDYLPLEDDQLRIRCGKGHDQAGAWLKVRDDSYALIEELVDVPRNCDHRASALASRLALTFSPRTCTAVVNAHAAVKGVKPLVIKRLLHKFAWFGMTKNALLNRDPFKGRATEFVKKYSSKTGTPNSATASGFGAQHEGRNVLPKDIPIFIEVLQAFYVGKDMSLPASYNEMLRHYYYQQNQHGLFPIRESRIPTWGEFRYHARRLIVMLGLRAEKEGDKDGKEAKERRGRDTNISGSVGGVFDMDATPFNKQLVCRYKVDGKAFNLGKVTVLVVFDRDSKKAVGWHVYVGDENWREGYRLALFCAVTSKTKHLQRLGIDDPTAFPDNENIACDFIYVDGGPGSCKSAQAAMQRLDIDFKLAPPATPYWKPTVEGGLGIAQRAQAKDPGGYERTNRARDKEARRNARLFAAESVFDLEKKLVKTLIAYNRARTKKHLLLAEMKMEGVGPSSQEIHSWGVKKMGGVENRLLAEAEVYQALLEHVQREVTVNGIGLFDASYNSDRLRQYRHHCGRNVRVGVMYHPLRPSEVYWLTPDGVIDQLERDRDGEAANREASVYDIEAWNVRLTAMAIVNRSKPKRKGKLSQRQRDQALASAQQKPKRQRTAPTDNEPLARTFEALLERQHREFDRPEVHAPNLAKQGASPGGPRKPATSPAPAPSADPAGHAPPPITTSGRVDTAELFRQRRAMAQRPKTTP